MVIFVSLNPVDSDNIVFIAGSPLYLCFGHIAWLESDGPANMVLHRYIDLSVGHPPVPAWI